MTRKLFDNKNVRRIGKEFDGSPDQYDVLVTGHNSSSITANEDGSVEERLEFVQDQLEILEDHIHKEQKTYPKQKDGVTVTGAAGAWDLGVSATIVGTVQNLDNAAAVDAGGGVVTIPLTGHGYRVGDYVAITGSVNYNATYEILAVAANTFNVTATFVVETFAGTEECIDVIPEIFDIHHVLIETASAADIYEVVLYKTDASVAANEIGRGRVSKDAAVSGLSNAPMQTPRLPAETRIFAKVASKSGGGDTVDISIMYHLY